MSKLRIVPNEKGGLIRRYESNPEFGYLVIAEEDKVVIVNNVARKRNRTTLLRGPVSVLKDVVYNADTLLQNYSIRAIELTEQELLSDSEVAQIARCEIGRKALNQNFEKAIEPYLKVNPTTDKILTKDGFRILRVNVLTNGDEPDILVQHDVDTTPVQHDVDTTPTNISTPF